MTELPSGTVTFLFTDIEGSTRLLQQLGERYANVLAQHRALVRAAITAHNGHEIGTEGDAFFVAFARTREAVAAALAAQRALAAHPWPEGAPVRVRMGLHSGEGNPQDGGYVGLDVHRAARIAAAAHSGQVLLSRAAQELARDALPEGAGLRDLGEHRLKDLARPEHLFQLVVPDLPADFPPPRTLTNRPSNLPAQLTSLIGRERERAAARALLSREGVRLVTLTGPGGTGKTRLALQVAAELADAFPDGVHFITLAPIRDPALVVATIAQTLGIREESGRSAAESLRDYLREKSALLLLDNCEQVAAAAPEIAALLAACPRLKVLGTSRAPLHLSGEHEFPVPPLALPGHGRLEPPEQLSQYEAVRLFIERALAVRPEFALTDENAPAVAEICHRLDGLPLAIELAAARIRLLSPQAMLARLDNRLGLLTGGARDLPARQRTLRDTVAWSHDLLDEGERRLFRRLSVFAGGWTLESAESVCLVSRGPDLDVLDGMASLVDMSLVRQSARNAREPRFTMLETIREFARELLEASGEAEAMRRRHVHFCLTLAETAERELEGARQLVWLDRLEAEHDNLREALAWSLDQGEPEIALRLVAALGAFWGMRGYLTEGREWLSETLAGAERGVPRASAAWAKALATAGWLAIAQGDYEAARSHYEQSMARAQDLGDRHRIASALNGLGNIALRQGNHASARSLYEQSLAIRRELGQPRGIAGALVNLAGLARVQGDYAAARSLYEQSLAMQRELGDKWGASLVLYNLAGLAREQGDYEAARSLYEQSLATSWSLGDRRGVAAALNNLGMLAQYAGDYAVARTLHEESLETSRELGDKQGIATALSYLAGVAERQGEYAAARSLHQEGLSLQRELGYKRGIVFTLRLLGHLAHHEGASERAARLMGAAEALREALGIIVVPNDRAEYDRIVESARARLGEATFASAWAEGRAMSPEQAIALALEVPPDA
jgi:predicted ATPase/class 3 adenylate cyclase/Tfp pilus assembly protein PilF